jgi:hypothetical protein
MDLALDGILVRELEDGEYVRYTAYLEDGSVHKATTDAEYDTVYTDDDGLSVTGWTDTLDMPDDPQKIKIVWEYRVGIANDKRVDYITVQDVP